MIRSVRSFSLAWVAACGLVFAQDNAAAAEDVPLSLLKRAELATRSFSFSGTVIYQQGDRTETSRLTRHVSETAELERLEFVEGAPREVVRSGEIVRFYLPAARLVKIERRAITRSFPLILPRDIDRLRENYVIGLGRIQRIAGVECREIVLTPKDGFRYGYRVAVDLASGMVMKASTFDATGIALERFWFADLRIGGVSADQVRVGYPTAGWRIEDSSGLPLEAGAMSWDISGNLPGFTKRSEQRRRLNDIQEVEQFVYSDGLAAVSVFVEAGQRRKDATRAGPISIGATNVVIRQVGDRTVTVVGDAPALSVRRMADAVRKPGARN
jgi:sigma-E factor negative regulatory protein RseB